MQYVAETSFLKHDFTFNTREFQFKTYSQHLKTVLGCSCTKYPFKQFMFLLRALAYQIHTSIAFSIHFAYACLLQRNVC